MFVKYTIKVNGRRIEFVSTSVNDMTLLVQYFNVTLIFINLLLFTSPRPAHSILDKRNKDGILRPISRVSH